MKGDPRKSPARPPRGGTAQTLHRLTRGLLGHRPVDDIGRAERGIRAHMRTERREANLEEQARLRREAVERRRQRRMRAAVYARDRRASA